MVKVLWSKRSLNDLKDILAFIAKDSPKYAEITGEELIEAVELLRDNPGIGRMVPEVGDIKTIREIIFKKYRIIYQIQSKKSLQVLTIHHSSRDLSANLLFSEK